MDGQAHLRQRTQRNWPAKSDRDAHGRTAYAGRLAVALGIAISSIAAEYRSLAEPTNGPSQQSRVVFETGFEATEGYGLDELCFPDQPEFDDLIGCLVGQNGWLAFESLSDDLLEHALGNGVLEEAEGFGGMGQQAYIGFDQPFEDTEFFSVFQPLNLIPNEAEYPIINFSVTMQIVDSTNGERDNFRWSVYNRAGVLLFTLDFNNEIAEICYALEGDEVLKPTGVSFERGEVYDLLISMNVPMNIWCATINGLVVVNSLPITTTGAALNISDIDAFWAIFKPATPGNNYMVFDDYKITEVAMTSIPPRMEPIERLPDGRFLLRVFGEPEATYVIEATTDLVTWDSIKTIIAPPPDGIFDFLDEEAPQHGLRLYRARQEFP